MTIGKNITLWFLILALLAVLGNAIAIQRIFGDAEASAVVEARHVAQTIALTIGSVQETRPSEPLFANPVALEGFVADLQRLGRHIEVVDTHKTIIAAVQPELVGRPDAGDPA